MSATPKYTRPREEDAPQRHDDLASSENIVGRPVEANEIDNRNGDSQSDNETDEWDADEWNEDEFESGFENQDQELCIWNIDPSLDPNGRYVYKPLTHPREFRLLLLQPGAFDEPIHCSLVHEIFSTVAPVEYEAISYTWADEDGNATKTKTIYLAGSPFSVTPSCEAVLKRVRDQGRRKVWIDAVCINQKHQDERGHQVQLMPDIYCQAERVLIYLGDLRGDEAKYLTALDSMDVRDAAQRPLHVSLDFYNSLRLPPHEKTVLQAVMSIAKSIFERRYFSRVWILQEVSLAKAALVICGGYQISWKYFQALPGMTSRLLLKDLSFPDALTLGTRKFHEQFDLLHLLDIARNSQATDPRDNVFGVFGMTSLPSGSLGFIANYNSSVEDAYIDVALNILDVLLHGTEGNGIFKLIVRAMGPRNHPRLPAWVPDWSRPVYPNIAQALQKPSIDLSQGLPRLLSIALRGDHEHRELLDLGVDKSRREISFNGARVCSLQELVEAGCFFDVLIPGHDSFRVLSSDNLDTLVETLEGCPLLTCYTLVCPNDCSLPFRNRMFLLSSSYDEFSFLGLCFIKATDVFNRLDPKYDCLADLGLSSETLKSEIVRLRLTA